MTEPERGLATTRMAVLAITAVPLAALGAVLLLAPPRPARSLVAPAALAGIVALAAGQRLHRSMLDRAAAKAERPARITALRSATMAPLAITGAAALFGVVAYHVSREPFALVGIAVHVVLAGAVWPTRARIARIGDGPEDPAPP